MRLFSLSPDTYNLIPVTVLLFFAPGASIHLKMLKIKHDVFKQPQVGETTSHDTEQNCMH